MCFLAYIPPKTCAKCEIPQDWDAFYSDKHAYDGMTSRCKPCTQKKNKGSYQLHQPKRVASARQRRRTHREHITARRRELYAENPEHFRAQKRAEYARDPEKLRKRGRIQHQKHLPKILEAGRRKYRQNPEAWVIRRQANLPAGRIVASRRRARKKNLPDTFTLEEREFMLQYWHHACAVCGNEEGFFWTLADDHVIPLSSPDCPGTTALNILPLCHSRKGAGTLEGATGCNNSKNDSEDFKAWLLSRYPPATAKRILTKIEAYFAIVRARKASEEAAD